METIVQILGVLGLLVSVLSMVFKKKTTILLLCIVYNVLTLISYLLLGKYLGCILVGVLTVKGIVYFLFAYFKKKPNIVVLIVFEVAVLTLSIILWESWYDAFILVNSLINIYSTWQDDVDFLKICVVGCSLLLVAYDVFAGAYTYIASEVLYGGTALITLILSKKEAKKLAAAKTSNSETSDNLVSDNTALNNKLSDDKTSDDSILDVKISKNTILTGEVMDNE